MPGTKKKSGNPSPVPQELLSITEITDHLLESAASVMDADIGQAEDILNRALSMSRNAAFTSGIGKCLQLMAELAERKGDQAGKYKMLQEAALCFGQAKLHNEAVQSYRGISTFLAGIGRVQESIEALSPALNHARSAGDHVAQGDVLNRSGELYQVLGQYTNAVPLHLQALELFEITGKKELIAETCMLAGDCYLATGEHDSAYGYFERGLKLAEEAGSSALMAGSTAGIARVYSAIKEIPKSLKHFNAAIEYARQANDPLLLAGILKEAGKAHAAANKDKIATGLLKEALNLCEQHLLHHHLPEIHAAIGNVNARAGDFEAAYQHLNSCIRISNEIRLQELEKLEKSASVSNLISMRDHLARPAGNMLINDQFQLQITHEIRTPLNGVIGMAELLLGTHPTPEQQEYINTIRLSAGNLLLFTDEIFEYQRLFNVDPESRNEVVYIRELINNLYPDYAESAKKTNVVLNLQIDPSVPEEFKGNMPIVRDLLNKLISYGIRSSAGGMVNIAVHLTDSDTELHYLRLQVDGSGINLSTSEIEWLRSESGTPPPAEAGITGITIAIIRKLAALTGGILEADGHSGKNTLLTVLIPIHGFEKAAGRRISAAGKPVPLLEVLLVEDNKVNQFLAQKLLTKMGFAVSLASNASEAVDALQREQFDAILMDVQMPVMTGYELTELIRTTLPSPVNEIPIIALTAYASPQEKEKAIACGMNDFITKPYSPEELKTVLLRVAEKADKSAARPSGEDVRAEEIKTTVERLNELFSGNKDDVLSLLHMLIVQIPQLLKEAGRHIDDNDWSGSFQSFHKIRSSINLLKIRSLSDMIGELEEFSKDSIHSARIPALFSRFSRSCEKAVGFLKEEVVRLKRN